QLQQPRTPPAPRQFRQYRLIEMSHIPKATNQPNKKVEVPYIPGEGDREGTEKRCNRNASEIDKQQANYHGSNDRDANKWPIRGDELMHWKLLNSEREVSGQNAGDDTAYETGISFRS